MTCVLKPPEPSNVLGKNNQTLYFNTILVYVLNDGFSTFCDPVISKPVKYEIFCPRKAQNSLFNQNKMLCYDMKCSSSTDMLIQCFYAVTKWNFSELQWIELHFLPVQRPEGGADAF